MSKARRSKATVFGLLVCLFLVFGAGAALAGHADDHQKGQSEERKASAQEKGKGEERKGSARQKRDGKGGSKSREGSGSGGSKADRSDDGEKPFDEEPNDHPSGKDRSEEPGGSGTQGKSESDPDGDANGGADKPGGTGGFDDDKDGNNGCGNDDDFEDDNNGWCGKPTDAETKVEGATEVRTQEETEVLTDRAAPRLPVVKNRRVEQKGLPTVLGTRVHNSHGSHHSHAAPAAKAEVLGAVLPFTGAGLGAFVVLGAALLGSGVVLVRRKA